MCTEAEERLLGSGFGGEPKEEAAWKDIYIYIYIYNGWKYNIKVYI
jgi:hypothetical protein